MLDLEAYEVGWICALSTEYVAAQVFLEEEYENSSMSALPGDFNDYTLGRIGRHHIVIAVLPDGEYGIASAAGVANNMLRTFPNIRIGLMVGIGGGAPSSKHDIRLGDVVVSAPCGGKGGLFQYDYGKMIQGQPFEETGFLNQPPTLLRAAVSGLKAKYEKDGHQLHESIVEMLDRKPRLRKKYGRPDLSSDRLFKSDIIHPHKEEASCETKCAAELSNLVPRLPRDEDDDNPTIHYGLIASANQLMKDATVRDRLIAEKSVLCFEMEAAGLMNHFPCLVVRGICDYADSHKNKEWQGYAAMAAAAYARDLLCRIHPAKIKAETKIFAQEVQETKAIAIKTNDDIGWMMSQEQEKRLRDWLDPPDPSTNLQKALSIRHEGSGQWFLQNTEYLSWKQKSNSFLWLNGKPGCGKTVLCSTIIEDLRKLDNHSQKLLYFHFDFSHDSKQSFDSMLRSLTFQLHCQVPGVGEIIESLYSAGKPTTSTLYQGFQRMLELSERVMVVLDALDECLTLVEPGNMGLFRLIRDLSTAQHVSLLVTSRPEQIIESQIMKLARSQDVVTLRNDNISDDICRYIQYRVQHHDGLSRWREQPDTQREIESALMEKADGMFRWVTCQLDALEDCLDYRTLRRALNSLPKSLDETYSRILDKIPPQHLPQTTRLLQFLTTSGRPLLIEQAVDAIAVDLTECPRFTTRNRMPVPEEILRYGSGLIVAVKVWPEYTILQLSHFSVKEWLLSERLEPNLSANFDAKRAHITIANVCLAYLMEVFQHKPVRYLTKNYPFAEYAARQWTKHASRSAEVEEAVSEMAISLLSDRHTLLRTWNMGRLHPRKIRPFRERDAYLLNPLCFAAMDGLFYCCQKLIRIGCEVNKESPRYGMPLLCASKAGYADIVGLLLEKGANVNSSSLDGYRPHTTALQVASGKGHDDIVRLLVENGAEVNFNDRGSPPALQRAAEAGHEAIIKLLLQNGAKIDLNPTDEDWQGNNVLTAVMSTGRKAIAEFLLEQGAAINIKTNKDAEPQDHPLDVASAFGLSDLVRLLLDQGADVNSRGESRSTPLQTASRHGHIAIVQTLLQYGADVNLRGKSNKKSPLSIASLWGNKFIVQMLLENGADIDVQNEGSFGKGLYGSALQAALEGLHEPIVAMLLDKGADVNLQCGHCVGRPNVTYESSENHNSKVNSITRLLIEHGADVNAVNTCVGSVLQSVSMYGHEANVRLLLEKGADVNMQGGRYGNALQAAVFAGNDIIVQLLIEHGANVNQQGGYCATALVAAAGEGQATIAQRLLENGADPNIPCKTHGNALRAAAKKGNDAMVRLLLEHGASDINQNGHNSALIAASARGYESVVRLPLESGANVNEADNCSALVHAARYGYHTIVRLLLEKGADVNMRCEEYGTALQAAASRTTLSSDNMDLVQLLLDHGADVNMQGGKFGNALSAALFREHTNIVNLLLDNGADPTAMKHTNIVNLLLDNGADPTAMKHTNIDNILLDNGADPTAMKQRSDDKFDSPAAFWLRRSAE